MNKCIQCGGSIQNKAGFACPYCGFVQKGSVLPQDYFTRYKNKVSITSTIVGIVSVATACIVVLFILALLVVDGDVAAENVTQALEMDYIEYVGYDPERIRTSGAFTPDAEYLVGEWHWNGLEYYVFNANGTGQMAGEYIRWAAGNGYLHICTAPDICGPSCATATVNRYSMQDGRLVVGSGLITFTYTRPGDTRELDTNNNEQAIANKEDLLLAPDTVDIVHYFDKVLESDQLSVTVGHIVLRRGERFDDVEPGMQYIAINFRVENISDDTVRVQTLVDIYADNVRSQFGARGANSLPAFRVGYLAPERIVIGYLGFVIPLNTSTIIAEFPLDVLGTETLTFVLDIS